MRPLRILVVDDSVVVRHVLSEVLSSEPDFEVSVAASGPLALQKMAQLMPDLVLLDVEMPQMDGLQTLEAIRKQDPELPVVMFSGLTESGAAVTVDALARGATDYFAKPSLLGSPAAARNKLTDELVPKIHTLCGSTRDRLRPVRPMPVREQPAPERPQGPITVVAIGASTGGPNALACVLSEIPSDFPVPVLVVQHMPPIFTARLAERLNRCSPLATQEARAGERVTSKMVNVAPGDYHMVVARSRQQIVLRLHQGPKVQSCRPAVDVLFESVARAYGAGVLAVILTGMGQDGLAGCRAIHEAGGHILAQDQPTSVVWGMPGYVANAGLADRVLPLDQIGPTIVRLVTDHRSYSVPQVVD